MPQFTQLNPNAKPGNSSPADKHARFTSKQKTVMFAGLLTLAIASGAALLTLNGCSKKEPVKLAAESSMQTSTPPAITPASPSNPLPIENQMAKKPVKKPRPSSTVSYVNRTYGLSLQYPRKYVLKTGEEAQLEWRDSEPVPMNFIQPGGVTVAAIELPRSMYPATDLESAFLMISVNRKLAISQCEQFAFPRPGGTPVTPVSEVAPVKVKLGEKEFIQVEQTGGDAMKQSDAKYYHVFENNACYEFVLGLGAGVDGADNETKPVNREEVFGKLEQILTTVKIKSASPVPEVTAAEQNTPPEHSDRLMGETTPKPIPPPDGKQ
jgi:hypothetical protein